MNGIVPNTIRRWATAWKTLVVAASFAMTFGFCADVLAAPTAPANTSDATRRSGPNQTKPTPAKAAAAWMPPKAADVKWQALAWLKSQSPAPSETILAKADALWANLPADAADDDLLSRLANTFALVNPDAEKLAALCREPRTQPVVPKQAWLRAQNLPPFVSANMRLYFAAWLIHQSMFDEAAEQLAGVSLSDVAAPATLLFCQSVVYHASLNKESGLESIDKLLERSDAVPRRYVVLAQMMQEDLKGLQADSLDYVARRMSDIHRRLDLGRAGPKVRSVEDDVIRSLDKMIKKIEEDQQKSQQQQSMADRVQSTKPAEESRLSGGKAPGDVAKKKIGAESGWGDLPPKQREEAMQQIGREFPSQYRDAIEEYFRRLAAEKEDD